MKTILLRARRAGLLAAALALAVAPPMASAQPAGAIGHPLEDGSLPGGTVMVRVIAGDVSKPVGDTEVHVSVAGVDHPARTNAEGRATLPGVAGGALVKITVKGQSGDVSSDEFPMPGQGGVRVMLSTAPMQAAPGGGMGGPMAGGGGMPEPRNMSGRGRPDEAVPPGTIIATVTYDDLGDKTPPVGAPIVLVGYSDATGITSQVVDTDASGRATFIGLDRTGNTGYFLLARLTRDGGVVDRIETVPPLQLSASAGWRVMLSAEKRTSKAPPVDDLSKLEPPADVPAGKILVSVAGVPGANQTAELYDAIARKVIAEAPLVPEPPHGVSIETSPVTMDTKSPPGSLGIQLARKMPQDMIPLPDLHVQVRAAGQPPTVVVPGAPAPAKPAPAAPAPAPAAAPASAAPAPAAPAPAAPPASDGPGPVLATGTSAKDGWLALSGLPTGVPLLVEVTFGDAVVRSTPVTLSAAGGGQITLVASWNQRGQYQAIFDAPDGPTATYLTQTTQFGKQFRSAPFQPVPDHGTASSIVVYPRVFLQFALDATAEDEYLAVRGEFAVRNFSWAPYRGGDDGLVVPLPDGFKGQVVAETQDVANDPAGFRILRPLPPFGFSFRGAYSLPIDGDTVDFDQPLPFGLLQGDFAVRLFPGMAVTPPTWLKPDSIQPKVTEGNATFYVMHNLTLMQPNEPRPPLRFTITGLPTPPAWKVLAPRIAGLIVILLLGVAAWIAIAAVLRAGRARASSAADRKRQVDALYEELVELEQDGGDQVRRAAVMAELERLLADDRARDEA